MEKLSPIDPANRVSLEVDGVRYEGWKSVRIRHSIEQLAGTFSLDVHDRWPGQDQAWSIEPGAACVVKIGPDPMITGYVDIARVKADPKAHTISIEGRDKAGDLVDCSAPPREWAGQRFEAVAVELLKPYGITLRSQLKSNANGYIPATPKQDACEKLAAANGGCVLPKKACNTGETVHKLLEKLAKIQGALIVSDRLGGLLVTRAGLEGRANDVLAMGENVLSIDYERSFANLFSEITVKAQHNGSVGQTAYSNVQQVKPKGTVKRESKVGSASINRYRPLVIMAEDQADSSRCQRRAEWEAGTREAKAKKLTIKVQGWRQSDGSLWAINTLTRVKCPWVREDEDMLISSCEYSLDMNGGTTTTMTLQSPQAYDVLPEIPKATAKTGKTAASSTGPVYSTVKGGGR